MRGLVAGLGANQSNRLDRIASSSLEIDDDQLERSASRAAPTAASRPRATETVAPAASRDRPNLRAEEQVVDDRDDHGKIIPDMLIRTAAVPPFYKNGYLVACERTRAGVLIDPGDEVDSLLDAAGASAST